MTTVNEPTRFWRQAGVEEYDHDDCVYDMILMPVKPCVHGNYARHWVPSIAGFWCPGR